MPIYEYLCESCGKLTEVMQKLGDPPPSRCGECGDKRLAKLVSHSAFQLKGGGWYADLYGASKKKAPESGGEKPAAAPDAKAVAPVEKKAEGATAVAGKGSRKKDGS